VTPVPQLPQAGTDTASITLLVMGIAVVMLGLLGVLVF
jgi:LPXTG-motif cell wall-anchored protein